MSPLRHRRFPLPTAPQSLFGPEGLRKLAAAESRQVLNSRQYTPIWSRREGARRRDRGESAHRRDRGDGWFARHA